MLKNRKRTILAIGVVVAAALLVAMIAYPVYLASAQVDYRYELNQENWAVAEESAQNLDATLAGVLTVQIDVKGYAFVRIDEETIKQYESTTSIAVRVQPATETVERRIDITGSVRIKETTYTITGGKAFLIKEKKLVFLNCTGTDENGNPITLKLGVRYFWWGGKAYALRSKAILQTVDKSMLLLQRGIAKIQ